MVDGRGQKEHGEGLLLLSSSNGRIGSSMIDVFGRGVFDLCVVTHEARQQVRTYHPISKYVILDLFKKSPAPSLSLILMGKGGGANYLRQTNIRLQCPFKHIFIRTLNEVLLFVVDSQH